MRGKSVPLSVRVSDEDAAFLANLEIHEAVTPSEKLRAILQEAQRRYEGLKDPTEGGLILRDMATPAWRQVRRLEQKSGRRSDLILKLYERLPDLMATLIAGPDATDTDNEQENLSAFEEELIDQTCVLLKDFISLELTSPVRVYSEPTFAAELKPVIELVELARHHQQLTKGGRNE